MAHSELKPGSFLNTNAALVQLPEDVLEEPGQFSPESVQQRLEDLLVSALLGDSRIDYLQQQDLAWPLVIGRQVGASDVALEVESVSKRHAQLRRTQEGWVVTDLSSSNGTFLEGEQLPAGKAVQVSSGQILGFSSYRCMLLGPDHLRVLSRMLEDSGGAVRTVSSQSTVAATLALPPSGFSWADLEGVLADADAEEFAASSGAPFLLELCGGVLERPMPFDPYHVEQRLGEARSGGLPKARVHRLVARKVEGPITVGRMANSNDVVLEMDAVSRCHARFNDSAAGWTVEDLGSPNGTYLEDRRLQTGTPRRVHSGQILRFSNYRCMFLSPAHLHQLAQLGQPAPGKQVDSRKVTLMNRILETPKAGLALRDLIRTVSGFTRQEFLDHCRASFLLEIPVEALDTKTPVPVDGMTQDITRSKIFARERSRKVGQARVHTLLPPRSEGLTIGRNEGCDLVLDANEMSKRHALFQHKGSKWSLVDLESKNGTYVDGVRVPAGVQIDLRRGSNLAFGSYRGLWLTPEQLYELTATIHDGRKAG